MSFRIIEIGFFGQIKRPLVHLNDLQGLSSIGAKQVPGRSPGLLELDGLVRFAVGNLDLVDGMGNCLVG